jgi:hypothetical protein
MSLVALANVIYGGIMRHRFHREPRVRAAELLLQERTPREVPARGMPVQGIHATEVDVPVEPVSRRFQSPRLHIPSTHLLSNGRYAVMITAAGSGYSRWNDLAVTRWREDVTRDAWGSYLFLRDVANGTMWSATDQPGGATAEEYEALFLEDRARILRRDGTLSTALEIMVSPRTTPRYAASRLPMTARAHAKSKSPPMPKSSWPRRPRTSRTRPSPICSSRPNICPRSAHCWRCAGRAVPKMPRYGQRTWWRRT